MKRIIDKDKYEDQLTCSENTAYALYETIKGHAWVKGDKATERNLKEAKRLIKAALRAAFEDGWERGYNIRKEEKK